MPAEIIGFDMVRRTALLRELASLGIASISVATTAARLMPGFDPQVPRFIARDFDGYTVDLRPEFVTKLERVYP